MSAVPAHGSPDWRAVRLLCTGRVRASTIATALRVHLEAGRDPSVAELIADLETALAPLPDDDTVAAEAGRMARAGARIVRCGEPGFPSRVAAVWPQLGAPPWLIVRGQVPEVPALAVVGTRKPTADGVALARAIATAAARAGVLVVSGMARGIDQAAHRGAIEAGGRTVAVLGTGLGVDYPRGDTALHESIAAHGALVTELSHRAPPKPAHFLERNRIVAALSDAVVVVEGRARSGALQTARLAAGQGRDVWAVPGSPNAPASAAPLALIRDGAQVLVDPSDPVVALGGLDACGSGGPAPLPQGLSDVALVVAGLLGPVPATATDLAQHANVPVPRLLAAAGELTAAGVAADTPRGLIRIVV